MRLRTFRTAAEALTWLKSQPFRHVGWTEWQHGEWAVWVPVALGRGWKG